MSHYDWLYDEFTLKETEHEIEISNKWILELNKRKDDLSSDLDLVTTEYTKKVISEEINNLSRKITEYIYKLNGWNKVKERIENGEEIDYEQAHNIVRGY
jgi:hypothetical protein